MEIPIKMDDLGVPPFSETPCMNTHKNQLNVSKCHASPMDSMGYFCMFGELFFLVIFQVMVKIGRFLGTDLHLFEF